MENEKKEMLQEQESKKIEIVKNIVDFVTIGVAIGGGYLIGANGTKWKINSGLLAAFRENPELETMLDKALKKARERYKK